MRRVGYSEFRDFLVCPLKHHWKYREKRAEVLVRDRAVLREFGTLLQKTVEIFYLGEMWRQPDPLAGLQAALVGATKGLPAGYHHVLGDAQVLLPSMLRVMRQEQLVGVRYDVERRVSLTVRNISIEGRLDLVVDSPAGVTLVDGKAGSTFDRNQLRVYALALRSTAWGLPVRVGTWLYKKALVEWMVATPKALAKYWATLEPAMDRYAIGSRAPRVGSHCTSCGYQTGCDAYRLSVRDKQARAPAVTESGFISLEDL